MASQVLGRLADRFENLLKARDLLLRLAFMLLKRRLQLFRLCGLRHLRQRAEDFLFREVDVFPRGVEESLGQR